jgi:hypothetical protein
MAVRLMKGIRTKGISGAKVNRHSAVMHLSFFKLLSSVPIILFVQACCEKYHCGEAYPLTPEALMRTRFSAYVKHQVQ